MWAEIWQRYARSKLSVVALVYVVIITIIAVAAPLTAHTEGMLGPAQFAAMKRGVIYVNVSRGGVAQEPALLEALRSGQVAGAANYKLRALSP